MVMAALEDKTYPGAGIASPSMAWVWGTIPGYSGPYHLVWSRDLYQVATAQIAAGDRASATRALEYLWKRQQQPDGCFPQNSNMDGSPHWPNLQLDEVADPILLAWQLRRFDADTWSHVERAVGCILARGPASQERWENAEGYSPATIAATIAALVCAAEIAERNGAAGTAAGYREVADRWQRSVEAWTRTTNGPLSDRPYYLRLTVDGNADAGTRYTIGDGGPMIDQRRVVDTSYLELVRLGVKRADDRAILDTLPVVDRELGVMTPNGEFWHRYNHDGYGETPDGGPFPGPGNTGRLWPLLAGERGEYELAFGDLTGDRADARRARVRATGRDRRHGRRRADAARAGLGREPAVRPARLRARDRDAVRDAAGVDARPVRPPGLVDRRRPPGRAPERRRRPIRRALAQEAAVPFQVDITHVLEH